MNEKNFEILKNTLRHLGFGESLNEKLETALREGRPEFLLTEQQQINKEKVDFTLQFRKGNTDDIYLFNRYKATVNAGGQKPVSHVFTIEGHKGIIAKEAYNLLSGRSVYKEMKNLAGGKFQGWIKLDLEKKDERGRYLFMVFNEHYRFDLRNALLKLPLQGCKQDVIDRALISLERGNLIELFFEGNKKYLIAAIPELKTISVFDEKGNAVNLNDTREADGRKKSVQHTPEETHLNGASSFLGKYGAVVQELEDPRQKEFILASMLKNNVEPITLSYMVTVIADDEKIPAMLNYEVLSANLSVTKRNNPNYVFYDSLVEGYNLAVADHDGSPNKSSDVNFLLQDIVLKYDDLHLYNFEERSFHQVSLEQENRGTLTFDQASDKDQRIEVDGIETRWVLEDELDLEMDFERSVGMKR